MISTIENISFILYVYYCHLNHLFCQILVGTPTLSIVRFQSGIFGLYDSNSNNWGCSPKSPLFEHKTDIILRNRHWHRFRSFIVVYFIFCFRKKIFFQSQQYNIGFFWKHFLRFFDFFQNEPQIFLPEEILSLKSSILPIAMKVGSKDADWGPHLLRYFSYKTMQYSI